MHARSLVPLLIGAAVGASTTVVAVYAKNHTGPVPISKVTPRPYFANLNMRVGDVTNHSFFAGLAGPSPTKVEVVATRNVKCVFWHFVKVGEKWTREDISTQSGKACQLTLPGLGNEDLDLTCLGTDAANVGTGPCLVSVTSD